jgi:hypothetical protein
VSLEVDVLTDLFLFFGTAAIAAAAPLITSPRFLYGRLAGGERRVS